MRKRIVIIAAALVLLMGIRLTTSTCANEGVMLYWPISDHRIHSAEFAEWHQALDISANPGTTVFAAGNGVVTWAGWRTNGGGLVVEVDHGYGVVTTYNHLSLITTTVGAQVTMNTKIGEVGSTGNSTGPHLHFSVAVNGVFIDPIPQLNNRQVLPDTAMRINSCD